MAQPKTKKRTGRSHTRLVGPSVTLKDATIIFAGMRWSPSTEVYNALVLAGALSIGQATPQAPANVRFPTAAKAREVFEGAFNCEPAWYALTDSVPDDTGWFDPATRFNE